MQELGKPLTNPLQATHPKERTAASAAYENWYLLERYQDFWEWYENKYEQTRDELWAEFEKFEEEHDKKFENEY